MSLQKMWDFSKADCACKREHSLSLSHAVIVARELGIPAVVSCQCASGVLKTGDLVRVDGTSGKVIMIEQNVIDIDEE